MDFLFNTPSTDTTLTRKYLIRYQIKNNRGDNQSQFLVAKSIGKGLINYLVKENSTNTLIPCTRRNKASQPVNNNIISSLHFDDGKILFQKDKERNSSCISDEHKEKILKALDHFEGKKIFKEKGITLYKLSKKINTNSSYLSKVVNSYKKKKFSAYLNDLRIDYAVKELKNNRIFRSYSVKHIALELGYKTRGSFSKAFKQKTGIHPSFYIKQLQNGTT